MDPINRVKSVLKLLDIPPSTHCDFSQNGEKESTTSSNGNNPFSFSGFLSRICTYKPQFWSSAPKAAVCLARHGFISIQDNKIQCSGCDEVVDVSFFWGKREFESVSKRNHKDICKWSFLSTSEEFFQLPVNTNCMEYYKKICDGLMNIGKRLPVIETSKLKPDVNIPEDFVKSVLDLFGVPSCKQSVSAIVLGLCGWEKVSNNTFQCTFCKRTCATWNFFSSEDIEWRIEFNSSSYNGESLGNNIPELHIESNIKDDRYNKMNGKVDLIFNEYVRNDEEGVSHKSRNISHDSKDDEHFANLECDYQVSYSPITRNSCLAELPNDHGNNTSRNDFVPPALDIVTTSNSAVRRIPISTNNFNVNEVVQTLVQMDDKNDCFIEGNFNKVRINNRGTPFDKFLKYGRKKDVEHTDREVTEESIKVLENEPCYSSLPYDDNSQKPVDASEIITHCDDNCVNNPEYEDHEVVLVYPSSDVPSINSNEGNSVYWVNEANDVHIDNQEYHNQESPSNECVELCSDETSTSKDDGDSLPESSSTYFSLSECEEICLKSQYKGKYCTFSAFWNAGKAKAKAILFLQSKEASEEDEEEGFAPGVENNYDFYGDEHNVTHVLEEEELSDECNDEFDASDKKSCNHNEDQEYVITRERNKDTTKLNGQQSTHCMSNIEFGTNMNHVGSGIYNKDKLNTNDEVSNLSNKFLLDRKCYDLHNAYDTEKRIALTDAFEDSETWSVSAYESINDSNKLIDCNETKEEGEKYQTNYIFNEARLEDVFVIENVEKQVTNDGIIEIREDNLINKSKSKKHETISSSAHSPKNNEINQEYQLCVPTENESKNSSSLVIKENYSECGSSHGCDPDSGNHCELRDVSNTVSFLECPLQDSTSESSFLDPGTSTKFSNSPSIKDEANRPSVLLATRLSHISEDGNVIKGKSNISEATIAYLPSSTRNNKRKREEMDDSDDCYVRLKTMKLEREKVFFHPVLEHQFWCIWRLNQCYPDEISSPKKGWQVFLETIYEKLQKEETERKWNTFSEILNCISTLYNL